MNTFLQNLVRRSAGLPLSSTAAPLPSHYERRVGATEPLQEVASEETAQQKTEGLAGFQIPGTSELSATATPAIRPLSDDQQSLTSQSLPNPAVPFNNSSSPVGDSASQHGEPLRTISKSIESQAIEVVTRVRAVEPVLNAMSESEERSDSSSNQHIERPRVFAKAAGAHSSIGEISTFMQPIRPADAERPIALQFPKVTAPPQLPPEPVPIHVRVGRVEVRGGPPQAPIRSTPANQGPLGFARYHRMRRYRS